MGLKQNSNEGLQYLKFKEGLFYSSRDKEVGYNEIEGYITGFALSDEEYEGKPVRKLVVKITDEDGENYILKTNFESSYATNLISFLKNADLSAKISLVGTTKDDKEKGKKVSSILVKQNGGFMKGFYTKDNPNGLPRMKEVTVNKKKVWDKAEMLDFLEDVVVNEFNSKVGQAPAPKEKQFNVDDLAKNDSFDKKEPVAADDLPF